MDAEYSFRVAGRLTPRLLKALDPLTAVGSAPDTQLVGHVGDRAALHGFIARIEALGLELVELHRLPSFPSATGCCPACGSERGVG